MNVAIANIAEELGIDPSDGWTLNLKNACFEREIAPTKLSTIPGGTPIEPPKRVIPSPPPVPPASFDRNGVTNGAKHD